jgi:hypothetical protein
MFRATSKAKWTAFAASLPADALVDEIGGIDEDTAYHINVRLMSDTVAATLAQGSDGVTWLDPDTVNSPSRIWAGGMNYWKP